MGKQQREKGKRGEREVVNLLKEYGFGAKRFGYAQAGHSTDVPDVLADICGATVYIEVKRRKKFPQWLNYDGKASLVFFREDNGKWHVLAEARSFLDLVWGCQCV